MTVPGTVAQVLFILLAMMPGFVFSAVRARRRGPSPDDQELSVRLLRSFGVSAALLGAYTVLFGSWGVQQIVGAQGRPATGLIVDSPRQAALLAIILIGVIPAGLAVLDDLRQDGRLDFWKIRLRYQGRYHAVPSAWDFAGPQLGDTFIRVRLNDGTWVGGWFSADSFLSSYPEPRDLFIQSQWKLDETGRFIERVEGTRGVYVSCGQADVIEWVEPPTASADGGAVSLPSTAEAASGTVAVGPDESPEGGAREHA